MFKKSVLILAALLFWQAAAVQAAEIILVTEEIDFDWDGLRDDHSLESFLISEGHNVDVRPEYWNVLTPDKIAELNAADLIIVSRLAWSSRYNQDNEKTEWNSLTTPLLTMNSHFARNSRWEWVNSEARALDGTSYIYAEALDPYHPVFRGVLTAPEPIERYDPIYIVEMIDPLVGTGFTAFIDGTDMGNGRLIAKPVGLDMGWIAEWDAGVEFFDGAGQYAGGKRMLFCAGTFFDPDRQEVITRAQGELNLTAEGLQTFRNAIDYLLNPEFADLIYDESTECIVAHWKLDEIEGWIAYDSVGDNDGTLYGNPIWRPMGGMLGGALEFDSDNDYVDCGTFNPSDATGQLSICLWAKWNGFNGRYQSLIGKRNSWNANDMMWQLEANRISGDTMFEREGYAGVAGGILTEGDWEHWCVTFDGATAIIYRMGEEVNRGAFSFGSKTDAQVALGGSNNGNQFNGALDDVRIYNIALTELEILAVMEGVEQVDITAPGDIVQGVPNDGDWPTAYYRPETPEKAIDDNIETKYLHFKGDFVPDPGTGGAGFQVTPSIGPTIVTGLTLTTANDFPGRDPIAFELSGSNEGIDGPYELIASGDIVDFAQPLAWPRLTMNATPISFKNYTAYAHYQLIFTAIRGPVGGSVNSMQIAEVELLGVPAALGGANIILVTEEIDWDMDGLRDDHSLESFLVSEGYNVDVRPDYWKVLTPDKIAELNAADLIIFSRLAWSDRYDEGNETTDWNSITTPLLQMNAYFARNTRWKWVNSWAGTPDDTPYIHAEVLDLLHPIFIDMLLSSYAYAPDGGLDVVQIIDPLVGTGLTTFIGGTDMGNGQLLAKPVGIEMGWIAEWDAGVEFFEGSGQYAGGKRMLFCAGTQEIQYYDYDRQEVITTAQGELNLTAEGLQMFRNAIDYLLKPEFTDDRPNGRI